MDHKFVSTICLITNLLAATTLLIFWSFTSWTDSVGILVGALWGCANIYFLSRLLRLILKLESNNALKLYAIIGIKFPLLYLTGYGLLNWGYFPILNVVFGFSLIFVAIFLVGLKNLFTEKHQEKVGS